MSHRSFGWSEVVTSNSRIDVDPSVLGGKPVIRGTRLSVEHVLELMASAWAEQQILTEHPGIDREDLLACCAFAAEVVRVSSRGPHLGPSTATADPDPDLPRGRQP